MGYQETKAERIARTKSAQTVRAMLDRAAELDLPCEHGHFGCAAEEEGACSDELHALAVEMCIIPLDD